MLNSAKFSILFICWLALITFLSLASFSDYGPLDAEIPHLDKAVHFTFYFVATILGCFFLRERSRGSLPRTRAFIYIGIFLAIYGTVIEVLQLKMTEDRSGEFLDFLANLSGILLALWMLNYLFSSKTNLNWKY